MPVIIDIDQAPTEDLPYGRGKMIRLFDASNFARAVDVHMSILKPGVTKGHIHYHETTEDIYIILEGEGKIVDKDGNEHPVRGGQAVFFKPGRLVDTHELYNTGRVPLRLIEVYAQRPVCETEQAEATSPPRRDFSIVKMTE